MKNLKKLKLKTWQLWALAILTIVSIVGCTSPSITKIELKKHEIVMDINDSIQIPIQVEPANADISTLDIKINDQSAVNATINDRALNIQTKTKEAIIEIILAKDDIKSNSLKIQIKDKEKEQKQLEEKRKQEEKKKQEEQQKLQNQVTNNKPATSNKNSYSKPYITTKPQTQSKPQTSKPSNPTYQQIWVASSGNGTKYHSYSGCSNMKSPIQISLNQAQAQGYTPCKKCH